jgi:hypothetical protein
LALQALAKKKVLLKNFFARKKLQTKNFCIEQGFDNEEEKKKKSFFFVQLASLQVEQ